MPNYGYKYQKKQSNRKRRAGYNNSLAKKAYRLAKKAYKAPELKHIEFNLTPASVSGTGSVTALDTLSNGTNNNTRIGDSVLATSVHYRMSIKLNATATDTLVRMIIFKWVSETPSAATDVLVTATVNSFKSEEQRYQSQILLDKVFRLSTTEKPEIFVRGKVKLNRLRIGYPQASAPSNRNGIYVLFVSDEAVNTPTISFNSRMYFVDP